mgnify:CR=1 FL=1
MIHNFKVENFYSINELQELSFTSTKKYSDSCIAYDNFYVNNVNCFVGANASGKTNIFRALSFFIWFAENSFYQMSENITRLFSSHKLREKDLTKFEIVFDMNNRLYKYSIAMTPTKLVHEQLEIKSQKGFSYLYKLENKNNVINIKYNRNNVILPKINSKEESRFKTKKMSTFFSFLLGVGYLDDLGLTGITKGGFRNVYNVGLVNLDAGQESIILSQKLEKSKIKSEILSYLKCFDFGIEDYVNNKFKARIKNDTIINLIGFKHSNNHMTFNLPILEESSGTIKGLYLLLNLLEVLSKGGVAIVDELDASLHYDIAKKLISLFANKDTNKKNSQLFFSTHQPLFLNDRDKTQIFLCYKEDYLNTEIYRLDEVEGIRNTENFFEKYLSGEYGAIPRLGKC